MHITADHSQATSHTIPAVTFMALILIFCNASFQNKLSISKKKYSLIYNNMFALLVNAYNKTKKYFIRDLTIAAFPSLMDSTDLKPNCELPSTLLEIR